MCVRNTLLGDMRIVSWNVKRLSVKKVSRVADAVIALDADVVFLSEWEPISGVFLAERLSAAGLAAQAAVHSTTSPIDVVQKKWGIFAAARCPIEVSAIEPPAASPAGWLELRLPAAALVVVGTRMIVPTPVAVRDWFLQQCQRLEDDRAVVLGDLNMKATAPLLRSVHEGGWIDAVALFDTHPPPTFWGDNGSRGRNDYALVTPWLASSITSATHVTEVDERPLAGQPGAISDHAALVIEVDPRGAEERDCTRQSAPLGESHS